MQAVRPRIGATPLLLFFCSPPKTPQPPSASSKMRGKTLGQNEAGAIAPNSVVFFFFLRFTSDIADKRWTSGVAGEPGVK